MAVKVLLSFPEEFLKEIDQIAAEEHRSRSELVREALRTYLGTRQEKKTRMKAIAEHPADYDTEMKAWDAASDEALTNFEVSLDGRIKRTPE